MIIDKNTWHYKLYRRTYQGHKWMPQQTNLCQYIRRLALGGSFVLFCDLSISIMIGILWTVSLLGKGLFLPWFGYLPSANSAWLDIGLAPWTRRYPGLPLFGKRWYPYHFVLIGLLTLGQYAISHFGYLKMEGLALIIVGTIVAIVALSIFYSISETGKLFRAFLDSKKQKICPVVEFQSKEVP